MTHEAKRALRRRCRINQLMMRQDESYRERLNRIINLFPVRIETEYH